MFDDDSDFSDEAPSSSRRPPPSKKKTLRMKELLNNNEEEQPIYQSSYADRMRSETLGFKQGKNVNENFIQAKNLLMRSFKIPEMVVDREYEHVANLNVELLTNLSKRKHGEKLGEREYRYQRFVAVLRLG